MGWRALVTALAGEDRDVGGVWKGGENCLSHRDRSVMSSSNVPHLGGEDFSTDDKGSIMNAAPGIIL